MKTSIKKLFACLLAGTMILTLSQNMSIIKAEEENEQVHVHDEVCGYVKAVEGHDCEHVHDEDCGYIPAVEEVLCDCTDLDGDGVIDHSEDCTYQPAVEGEECHHVHDEDCGYVEAIEGHDCEYNNGDEIVDGEPIDEDMNVMPLPVPPLELLTLPQGEGSIIIEKTVDGTELPDADTLFTFTVTTNDIPAVGSYTIDEVTNEIPENGEIQLKAGQQAVLNGLALGVYTIEESMPEDSNYLETSFTVNGGQQEDGLSATVILSEERPMMLGLKDSEGGWLRDQKGNLMKNTDGYFVYTITESQIDEFGDIDIECNELAEELSNVMMRSYNTKPMDFKLKLINETSSNIYYSDYDFTTVNTIPVGDVFTPDMENLELKAYNNKGLGQVWLPYYEGLKNDEVIGMTLDAIGFDGEYIRMSPAPLRCMNPAIISYFTSNPHKGELTGNSKSEEASEITLLQMNAFPELIKKEFTFNDFEGNELHMEADADRTYAEFICAFYRVSSLDELNRTQVYNVLGTGNNTIMIYGQSGIKSFYSTSKKNIDVDKLNDGTLDYFKVWGISSKYTGNDQNPYGPTYFMLETDPDILKLGYEYLYERGMRLTFDDEDWELSSMHDNVLNPVEDVAGLKNYIDKNQQANEHMRTVMNNGQAVADGESIDISNGKAFIEIPNAWNGGDRSIDFGFSLEFISVPEEQVSGKTAQVSFKNIYGEAEVETGILSVSKTVSGSGASTSEAFEFTVALDDSSINGTFNDMEFIDGQATFTLSHGESKSAELPVGISFTVEEDAKDYTAKVNGKLSTVYESIVTKNGIIEVNYNNYKSGGSTDPDEPDRPDVDPDDPKDPEVPVEIPEEEVPLGPGEEESEEETIVDITEPEIPLSDGVDNELEVPKTNDSSYFWLTSLFVSGAALIALGLFKHKKLYQGR